MKNTTDASIALIIMFGIAVIVDYAEAIRTTAAPAKARLMRYPITPSTAAEGHSA